MNGQVESLQELRALGTTASLSIFTVSALPELSTINGKAHYTNRFVACPKSPLRPDVLDDGVLFVRSQAGQLWGRIRDVP